MNLKYTYKNYLNLTTHTALGSSLPKWIGLLVKNKFLIDIRFLPKVLFITGNVILNVPFQLYEYLRYNKAIKKVKVQGPIFIVGHYRSGTTYLHNVLSKDPNFCFCSTYEALTPHVFLSTGNITKKILSWAMPSTRPQDNVAAGADVPNEEEFAMGNISHTSLTQGYYFPKSIFNVFDESVVFEKDKIKNTEHWKKHFDYFLKKLSYKNTGKRLILKSPANTARIKEILELYPDACFIHIHREPYTVYQSNVNLYEKILPLLSFQKADNKFMEQFILYAYEKMYKKFLLNKNDIKANQLIEMSYSDFVFAPVEQLQKVYKQLGLGDFEAALPYLQEEITSVKNYKTNAYLSLDKETKIIVAEKWGFMYEQYGYTKSV
ncbi:MAG TPA: sulfotransferase [Bacteroidia bacterium]|nr:sulfotransferase [Bacteroidia bacterium]